MFTQLTNLYIEHKQRKNISINNLKNHLNNKEVKILSKGANINSNKELLEERELNDDLMLIVSEIKILDKNIRKLVSLLSQFGIELKSLNVEEESISKFITNISTKSGDIINLINKKNSVISNYNNIKSFYTSSKENQFKL